jgi:hypothetical protein
VRLAGQRVDVPLADRQALGADGERPHRLLAAFRTEQAAEVRIGLQQSYRFSGRHRVSRVSPTLTMTVLPRPVRVQTRTRVQRRSTITGAGG